MMEDRCMKPDDLTIPEYQKLTNEILDHQKRREQLFLYTIFGLGVIYGLIFASTSPIQFVILSFVPYVLIINFCISFRINSKQIITLGSFIRFAIEPLFKETVHWETYWGDYAGASGKKKSKMNAGYWFIFILITVIGTSLLLPLFAEFSGKLINPETHARLMPLYPLIIGHLASLVLILIFVLPQIHFGKLNKTERNKFEKQWKEAEKNFPKK